MRAYGKGVGVGAGFSGGGIAVSGSGVVGADGGTETCGGVFGIAGETEAGAAVGEEVTVETARGELSAGTAAVSTAAGARVSVVLAAPASAEGADPSLELLWAKTKIAGKIIKNTPTKMFKVFFISLL